MGWTLGIESTAHTFSFGVVDPEGNSHPSVGDTLRPDEGGIHPREAADHHSDIAADLFNSILEKYDLQPSDFSAIAYSQGPGLAPCLRIGASVARSLSSAIGADLVGVNHCVAHIEIGRERCECDDPVLLYVSGGNTQVITRLAGRYRVLGETMDIGIGNMLDKFARENGIPFPGGPVIEQKAAQWLERNPSPALKGLELPYAVRGMDMAFSGCLTAARHMVQEGAKLEAVCWSLQEHAFAACVEVAERALAHTGKTELLLGGGVACNQRLREMCESMCEDRFSISYVPEKMYCIDNGTMIARLGWMQLNSSGPTTLEASAVDPSLRTDRTEVTWK